MEKFITILGGDTEKIGDLYMRGLVKLAVNKEA